MAIPAFRAAGTPVYSANSVANPTNLAPTKNVATVNGDLMVLVTAARSITATVATPSGWNLLSGFPKRSATASGGSIYVFTRVADGTASDAPTVTWSGLTTGNSGDSCSARILSWQNATTTADGTPPAANDAASTTSITIPAHTTSLAQSLVVGVAIRINDTAHTFTVATFTERQDGHTTSGTGHGTVVADRVLATAGSSGTATVTPSNTTSSRTLAVSFGLKAGPTSVTVNPATDTETAGTVTDRKTKAIGQVSTSETAQAITPVLITATVVDLGQVSDAHTATALTRSKARTLGQVVDTHTATALARRKTEALGQVSDAHTAQALTVRKARTLGQALETDTAQAIVVRKTRALGQAAETNTAQKLTRVTAYPDPADVRLGVVYGPGGIYTGTLRGGGGVWLRRR